MKLILPLFCFISFISNSTENNKLITFELEKHYRVYESFSSQIEEERTLHLFIAKNKKTKNFEIIPYFFSNQELQRQESFVFTKKPKIVTYHKSGNSLVLVVALNLKKDRVFQVVDLNNSKTSYSEFISQKNFKSIIKRNDSHVFFFTDKNEINLYEVKTAKRIDSIKLKPKDPESDFFGKYSFAWIPSAGGAQHIKYGPSGLLKLFDSEEDLILTNLINSKGFIKYLSIPMPTKGEATYSTYKKGLTDEEKRIRRSNHFVYKNLMFIFVLTKDKATIKVHNLLDNTSTEINIKDVKPYRTSDKFKNTNNFLKSISSGWPKKITFPNIAVNENTDGTLRIRVSKSVPSSFNYNLNNWHFDGFFNDPFFNFKYDVPRVNAPTFGGGPNALKDSDLIYWAKEEWLEVLIDNSGSIVSNTEERKLIHKDIDKDFYFNKILGNREYYRHRSGTFTNKNFRYMAYNVYEKKYFISEYPLKND